MGISDSTPMVKVRGDKQSAVPAFVTRQGGKSPNYLDIYRTKVYGQHAQATDAFEMVSMGFEDTMWNPRALLNDAGEFSDVFDAEYRQWLFGLLGLL